MDHFTEVKSISWLERYKRALVGLIFAPLFIFVAFIALKYGEIEHANTTNVLKNIQPKVKTEKTATNGDLFYCTDTIRADTFLFDKQMGLKLNAIKLFRRVYTWQWKEIIHKENKRTFWGGKTTTTMYDYKKGWHHQLIDHSLFKHPEMHENPVVREYDSLLLNNRTAAFGKYQLDTILLKALNNYSIVKLHPSMFPTKTVICSDSTECLSIGFFTSRYSAGNYNAVNVNDEDDYWVGPMHVDVDGSGGAYSQAVVASDYIFIGKNSKSPEIGDTKIVFWQIPEAEYTVMGQKNKNILQAYSHTHMFVTSEVSCDGFKHSSLGYFGVLISGKQTAANIFERVHNENNMLFIVLRLAGVLFMFGGFLILGHPLILLFGWLPFIGVVWEKLIFKILQILSFAVSLSISGFYWIKYNNIHNLSVWDLYFGVVIILLLLFCYSASAEVRSGNNTLYCEDF